MVRSDLNINNLEYMIQKIVARVPFVMPHPKSWMVSEGIYNTILQEIHDIINNDDWVEEQKPVAYTVMGRSVSDHNWLMQVLVFQALTTEARRFNTEVK